MANTQEAAAAFKCYRHQVSAAARQTESADATQSVFPNDAAAIAQSVAVAGGSGISVGLKASTQ
jgi:hypothetical protein